jgi:hypothetical protein
MASFQKRAGAWRALIRRKGYPALSATFDSKAEAECKAQHGLQFTATWFATQIKWWNGVLTGL